MTEIEKQIAEVEEARRLINDYVDKALASMEQNRRVVQSLKDSMNKAVDAEIARIKEQKDEEINPEVSHYLDWLRSVH